MERLGTTGRLAGFVIVLVTLVVYWPVRHAGFVWDDRELIVENQLTQANDGLYRCWFTTEAPDYYPVTWTLWWLEVRAWGNRPFGYHLVNVLLHAANAILVWLILKRLRVPGSWLAGVIFAVHPINVATVAWVVEQKNTLAMFFSGIATLSYLRFDEKKRNGWYIGSLILFLMALLSKTAVVMLPCVWLVCIWWRRGRLERIDYFRIAPFVGLSLILGLVTVWFQYHRALGGELTRVVDWPTRFADAGWIPWFYLWKLFWPVKLSVVYRSWSGVDLPGLRYLPALAWLVSLAMLWAYRRRGAAGLLAGVGCFLFMLFPVLGFFNQGYYRYSMIADHWAYFATVGPVTLVASVCAGIDRRTFGAAITGIVIVALSTGSWQRACVYQSERSLWQDAVVKTPTSWKAHYGLAGALFDQGSVADSLVEYRAALQINSEPPELHYNYANALVAQGAVQEAITEYRTTLEICAKIPAASHNFGLLLAAHINLANALALQGELAAAIVEYKAALVLSPDYAEAHNNLGCLFTDNNQPAEAIAEFATALRLRPDYPEAHLNNGNALLRLGRTTEAVAEYSAAVRARPDYPKARCNLAAGLSALGRTDEAMAQYREVLRVHPDWAPAQAGLALLESRLQAQ